MDKKDLDWGNLGFAYQPTDYSYVSNRWTTNPNASSNKLSNA